VGGSTYIYISVDTTIGRFSFGTADNGDNGASGGGGPFRFSKKERDTALFQFLATSGCNSVNHVSQSESRI